MSSINVNKTESGGINVDVSDDIRFVIFRDTQVFGISKDSVRNSVIRLLFESGIAKSRSDAKRMIDSGGIFINGSKVTKDTAIYPFLFKRGDLVLDTNTRSYFEYKE